MYEDLKKGVISSIFSAVFCSIVSLSAGDTFAIYPIEHNDDGNFDDRRPNTPHGGHDPRNKMSTLTLMPLKYIEPNGFWPPSLFTASNARER